MELNLKTKSVSAYYKELSKDQKLLVKIAAIIFIAFMIYKSGYVIGSAIYKAMQ